MVCLTDPLNETTVLPGSKRHCVSAVLRQDIDGFQAEHSVSCGQKFPR